LTEQGRKQAESLAKYLAKQYHVFDRVYTSPLLRTVETAAILAQGLLLPEPIADNRLKEMNHGAWEGKMKEEIAATDSELLRLWKERPEEVQMPEGELLSDVIDRAYEFFEQIADEEFTRVIVVTHDVVVRGLVTRLLRRPLNDLWLYEMDNTGYTVIEWDSMPHVAEVNVSEHLEGLKSDTRNQAL